MIDITAEIISALREMGATDGICTIYVTHTTAGVTINENADPDVVKDLLMGLERIAPQNGGYRHNEGNSAGHIKSTLTGVTAQLIIAGGTPVLGTWQSVFFCEFDGPRQRTVCLKYIQG